MFCDVYNLTMVVYSIAVRDLLYLSEDRKVVKGLIGGLLNQIMAPKDPRKNLCVYIESYSDGAKLPNGTWTGALGLLVNGIAHEYLKYSNPLIDPDVLMTTGAICNQEYIIAHVLSEQNLTSSHERNQLFASFDLTFTALALVTTLVFFAVSSVFVYFYEKGGSKFKSIIVALYHSNSHDFIYRTTSYGFLVFSFIVLTLIVNNVKTNKVLVDTSDIITDETKLFKSYRTAIWMEGEKDLELTRNAPQGTFLSRLYQLKNANPITHLPRYNTQDFTSVLKQGFWFIGSISGQFLVNVISSFYPRLEFFFNPKPFFIIYNVFLRRKGNTPPLQHIDRFNMYALENGLVANMVKQLTATRVKIIETDEKPTTYHSLESYVEDNSIFISIGINFFFYPLWLCVCIPLSLLAINLVGRTVLQEANSKRKRLLQSMRQLAWQVAGKLLINRIRKAIKNWTIENEFFECSPACESELAEDEAVNLNSNQTKLDL